MLTDDFLNEEVAVVFLEKLLNGKIADGGHAVRDREFLDTLAMGGESRLDDNIREITAEVGSLLRCGGFVVDVEIAASVLEESLRLMNAREEKVSDVFVGVSLIERVVVELRHQRRVVEISRNVEGRVVASAAVEVFVPVQRDFFADGLGEEIIDFSDLLLRERKI